LKLATRAGDSKTAPDLQQPFLDNPRSPRLRNPDQLRRGDRSRPHPDKSGSILDADRASKLRAD
jgi:hypothetical protein